MKRILISMVLIALSFTLKAQIPISNLPNTTNPVGAYVPVARGGFNYKLLVDSIAAGKLDSVKVSNDTLYSYKRGVRTFLGVIVGGSGTDTTSLSNRINLKVNISDTATMLTGYTRVQRFLDSLSAHTTRFNGVTTSLGTKLNISDTANIKPRLYAGTNVTITGTYPNLTIASSGGGGGSQTLQQTTDLGDSTTGRLVTNDSLKAQDGWVHGSLYLGDTLYSRSDSLIAFGTSITAGSGVSGTQRFSYLIAARYGMIEANFGAGGATLNSLYTALYKIPTKTSNRGALMFEYGMNDAATLDTNTFKTRYRVIVDTAIARGWTPNKIILVGGPFSEASLYTHIASYSRATQTVAEEKGTKYFNAYSFMQAGGGTALTADSVHPTALGHAFIFHAANKAFLEFKKTGLVDITGSLIVRKIGIFGSVPATSSYPVGSVAVFNGKTQFTTNVFLGDTVLKGSSAMLNISTSGGQDAISIKDNSSLGTAKMSGSEINVIDASNNSTKIRSTSIVVGNGSLSISGSAGRRLMDIGVYGGITVNEDGNTDDFRIEGDGQTHLFYTSGTNDRIGIRTSSPDSILTVNGSVHFNSTARFSGVPSTTDTTTYKPFGINSSGSVARMTSWPVGSGGGTTYKIGTYNSQTSSVNGASIVSDSIYMQAFSAENPGLVPAGGSGTTYLRGDGTWQTISGGTGYVDSVSNNAGGDSLIVVKGSNRYAYKYPASSGTPWVEAGNNPTSGWTEGGFLGTTTNKSLLLRTNNILRARIDSAGAAGIFRLYPATRTDSYLDFGTTANIWNLAGTGVNITTTSAVSVTSNSVATAAFYNGGVTVGSGSGATGTRLQIDNQSSTLSAIKLTGTTLKTTPVAGDIDRDHSYLYVTLGSATRQKIATDIDTLTLTNKRITSRVGTTASSASLTIASDSYDRYTVTALAAGMTINNPSGTPTDGQTLLIRIKDNGTARALTWSGSQFRVIGVTLPTTTVISKTVYIGLIWNSADSKWDVVSVNQEA